MSFQNVEPLSHDNAHGRPEKLDPRVNGPFLDDIRREQEKAYREQRMAAEKSAEKKPAAKKVEEKPKAAPKKKAAKKTSATKKAAAKK